MHLLLRETVRASTTPRWAVAVLTCTLVAILGAGDVEAEAFNGGHAATVLDVHAAIADNLMYVGYLLLTTFAFVAGDRVAADLDSGYVRLVVSRGLPVTSWWLAKLGAGAWAALKMAALTLATSVLVGAVRGLPVTAVPSPLATAAASQGHGLFPQVPQATNMVARQVGVAAYMAACFFSVLVVVMALTTRWPQRALPVVVVLVGLMADYVAVKSWEPWRAVSPGLRLLEGVHRPTAPDPLSLGTSGALYGGLVVASVVFGLWNLKRRDL